MSDKNAAFEEALKSKRIGPLTLDHNWHVLFSNGDVNPGIKRLEEELNELIKRQGKVTTESKEIKVLKKKLMEEIVPLADAVSQGEDAKAEKKLEENKRLIEECNEKLDAYQDEMLDLPIRIREVNHQLMLLTMEDCYTRLKTNEADIEEIDKWVKQIRIDLKKKLIRKQEKEQMNHNLYSYMHAVFGADVIDLFDMKYEMKEDEKDG